MRTTLLPMLRRCTALGGRPPSRGDLSPGDPRRRRHRARGFRAAWVVGVVLALLAAHPGGAAARTLYAPGTGPLRPEAFTGPLRDTVVEGASARAARAPSVRAAAETLTAPDGSRVQVEVSPAYAATDENRRAAQAYVDFVGSLPHGSELGRLQMFVGTPDEIRLLCRGGVACYFPAQRRMHVSGENTGPVPVEYVLTHEYGHHIATFRRNDPWPAIDWGAKYWASYERVCAGVIQRRYFPGNQGEQYLRDPGESFADVYAHLRYPSAPFQFDRTLAPDAGAFQAIRRDVTRPWTRPRSLRFRGSLNGGRRSATFSARITLDGVVGANLRGPRGSEYEVQLFDGRRLVDRSRQRGSSDRLALALCRDRPVETATFRVVRRAGAGPFELRVSYPG